MRFGRKLALQVTSDQTGAPYLSHKAMKEAINKTVRDLRLYQARWQSLETRQAAPPEEAWCEELGKLEQQIKDLDRELFAIVDEDLEKIHSHIRQMEASLEPSLCQLQDMSLRCGLLLEETQLNHLQEIFPVALESPAEMCQRLIELRMMQDPAGMAGAIHELIIKFNQHLEEVDEHTQYLEINVAGFRKLLKRHEKQVPHKFHASQTPCLGFHRLVTRSSRQLVEITTVLGRSIGDAVQRLDKILPTVQTEPGQRALRTRQGFPELREPKGLGPECQMVLQIQAQLKEQAPMQAGPIDFLYPKPNLPMDRRKESYEELVA